MEIKQKGTQEAATKAEITQIIRRKCLKSESQEESNSERLEMAK